MSQDRLKAQLKSLDFDALYVFYGEEAYLRKYYLENMTAKCIAKEFMDFNLSVFDGKEFDFDAFAASIESYPMMSDKKMVVVKNLVPPTLNAKMIERVKAVLEDIPPTTLCVFEYDTTYDIEGEKKYGAMVKMFGLCNATIVNFTKANEHDLARWVSRHFASGKKRIDTKDIYYMLSICDNNMESLQNEIAKLITYTQTDTITKKQIDALVTKSVEATVYQLSDAILNKNYDGAFKKLSQLLYLRVEPVMILGSLSATFITVYKVKTLQASKVRGEELAALAGIRRQSLVSMYTKMADKVSPQLLKFILQRLSKADIELKSSKIDNRTILELMLGAILNYEQEQTKG